MLSRIIKPFARQLSRNIDDWSSRPHDFQHAQFEHLINKACNTQFGFQHNFNLIRNYEDFKKRVPLRTYEDFRPFINLIFNGQKDVLWPGKPVYFVGTSGTTSGIKYLPLTKDSIPYHFKSARNAVMAYAYEYGFLDMFDGKLLFLSGSPKLNMKQGFQTGRLSGIVNHQIPTWLRFNQIPGYNTNCIQDWEQKIEKIIDEALSVDLRMVSGIPPWTLMFYERLLLRTGAASISQIFPKLNLFVHGGVNINPYQQRFEQLHGAPLNTFETYPATEGFIAFQDAPASGNLLLNLDAGVFYEFVPLSEIHNDQPSRLALHQVEKDQMYVVIINNNAGLWAYNLGDTIKFSSLNPYKIQFCGRVHHYISAFGEHVMGSEVEKAISQVSKKHHVLVNEFTVAPQVNPSTGGLPFHEWHIEFEDYPYNLSQLENELDIEMQQINFHYKDLIHGKIIAPLRIIPVVKGTFNSYMKQIEKLGGQYKLPRLSNNRLIVNKLQYQMT